ncbi:MAG: bifunctional pyr operon transcriptional regulator/uracil phosphoribosyltransferase PyrR [Candidatus Omnitrophica bacterium]|nr:bifunctional pyr operon transcriptional regulator/uracil phosphoribosyltransferase PyrR [Candidatus Omnitrophota bacterium]
MTAADMDRALTRAAHEILERNPSAVPAIIGIRTRGEFLARRVVTKMGEILASKGQSPEVRLGILDINLYRDDLTRVSERPVVRETVIGFSVDDQVLVLVDDVLFTGRTVRSAMNALMDYGRPKAIQLAVLIDRGHRELPVKADFVGKNIPTNLQEVVHVHMKESDGEDFVSVDPLPASGAAE